MRSRQNDHSDEDIAKAVMATLIWKGCHGYSDDNWIGLSGYKCDYADRHHCRGKRSPFFDNIKCRCYCHGR